jgi:uncharacterized protein (DUF58 family)
MSLDFMNPAVVMSIRSLELRARLVVDGFRTGLNKSPRHGFSVEFSEYRAYSPGDDPRFFDWKLYGRSDRSYIRLFEDETNLRCYIVLDVSRSMSFGSLGYSKHDYARTVAASLAWLLNCQSDAVGLTTFDSHVRSIVPARYRPGQFRRLLVTLEEPATGLDTQPRTALEDVAQRLRKRGLVILISDLLAPVEQLEEGLPLLRGSRHDLVVFQVLDPAERTLQFEGPRLFEDLETGQTVFSEPDQARIQYVQRIQQHNAAVQAACEVNGAGFRSLTTDQPLELALAEFLQARRQRSAV